MKITIVVSDYPACRKWVESDDSKNRKRRLSKRQTKSNEGNSNLTEKAVEKSSAPNVFTALSRFVIAGNMQPEVKQAFLNRPHPVDDAPGFLRLDVSSPIDNELT